MKIILAAKSAYPFHPIGGVQKYVYNLAKFLFKTGVDVEIVVPLDGKKERSEIFEGIKYTLLHPAIYSYLEYPAGWLGVHIFSRRLSKYLKDKDFDLLHSFDMTGYQYLKNPNRKPVIAHVFSDNYLTNPIKLLQLSTLFGFKTGVIKQAKVKITPFSDAATKIRYFPQYLLKIRPMAFCFGHADSIFFEEMMFYDEIQTLFRLAQGKKHILPVGIDLTAINERTKKAQLTKRNLDFDESDLILITVNRLAADKGVDKIILSFAEIRKYIPHAKLIVVGDGYQEKEILELISNKGLGAYVRHFRNLPEGQLYDLYHLSDIYICAFSYPGSSISTLEAMACGLAVITTAQPWLVEDKRNGIFIESNDPVLIENAVRELFVSQQWRQKGINSKAMALQYDWSQIAQKSIGYYTELLKK